MESVYDDSNHWLNGATSISRNELREAARLLPQYVSIMRYYCNILLLIN